MDGGLQEGRGPAFTDDRPLPGSGDPFNDDLQIILCNLPKAVQGELHLIEQYTGKEVPGFTRSTAHWHLRARVLFIEMRFSLNPVLRRGAQALGHLGWTCRF